MTLINLLKIAFSKTHIDDFDAMYIVDEKNHVKRIKVMEVMDKKINKIAFTVLSIATLGTTWLIYNLYSGYRKIKIIKKDHLNFNSIIHPQIINKKSITFALSGGRLGDNLVCFLSAYNFAFKNNLSFYYTPFADSEKFCLSDVLDLVQPSRFKTKINFQDSNSIKMLAEISNDSSTLITIAPFVNVNSEWNHPGFKEAAKELIKPKEVLNLVSVPTDKIAIALHMRMGGGFDSEAEKRYFPAKFPPTDFYEAGLRKMIDNYGTDQKFYVYLFTDDKNPKKLAEGFKEKFPDIDIEFGYRDENSHDKGVLEDMFGMA